MFAHLIAAAILFARACASPALAAGEVGGVDCAALNDPDTFVVADPDGFTKDCTRIIGGAGTPREKSVALINRSSALRAKTISGASDDVMADRAAADADLDEAVRLDPTFAFAFYARGLGASFGPRRGETQDFDEAIRLDANFALAYLGRARAYADKGDYLRAEADCSAAIRLDANLARAFLGRGGARRMNGDDDGAITDFGEALRLSPNASDIIELNISIRADAGRGEAYFARGEFDRAVADFNDAIRLDPKDEAAFRARGIVELMRGSLDQARADLAEATELWPAGAEAALWREIADRRAHAQGRLAEAEEKFPRNLWPTSAVRAFLDEPNSTTMLAEASDAPDGFPTLKQWQICQAYVFTGELALLKEAKTEAADAFDTAAKTCPKGAPERGVVAVELKGFGTKP